MQMLPVGICFLYQPQQPRITAKARSTQRVPHSLGAIYTAPKTGQDHDKCGVHHRQHCRELRRTGFVGDLSAENWMSF